MNKTKMSNWEKYESLNFEKETRTHHFDDDGKGLKQNTQQSLLLLSSLLIVHLSPCFMKMFITWKTENEIE